MSYPVQVQFVGNGYSGKTSLLLTLLLGSFPDPSAMSQCPDGGVNVDIGGQSYNVHMWDIIGYHNGAERLRPLSYFGKDVFLLLFSVVHRNSFDDIRAVWIPELREHCPNTPIVLVGAKADLRDDNGAPRDVYAYSGELVQPHEGENFAREMDVAYIEVSALTMLNVPGVLELATRLALEKKGLIQGSNSCGSAGKKKCAVM